MKRLTEDKIKQYRAVLKRVPGILYLRKYGLFKHLDYSLNNEVFYKVEPSKGKLYTWGAEGKLNQHLAYRILFLVTKDRSFSLHYAGLFSEVIIDNLPSAAFLTTVQLKDVLTRISVDLSPHIVLTPVPLEQLMTSTDPKYAANIPTFSGITSHTIYTGNG